MKKTEVKMRTTTKEPGLASFQVKETKTVNINIRTGGGKLQICPICGKEYEDRPAISRKDNKTEICPDCGTLEALEAAGFDKETQEDVLHKIQELRKGAK